MKKILLSCLLFLVAACIPAVAQTHSVSLSWSASATVGVSSYNIYRAPCTGTVSGTVCSAEGTFTKIGTVSAPTHTYTDSTVTAGSLYSYYATSVCPATGCSAGVSGESAASTHLGASVPTDPPLPPGNLSITSVARNSTGANTTVTAGWADVANVPTTYTFYGNGGVLGTGTLSNATGTYTAAWTGKLKPGASISVEICDSKGACASRLI